MIRCDIPWGSQWRARARAMGAMPSEVRALAAERRADVLAMRARGYAVIRVKDQCFACPSYELAADISRRVHAGEIVVAYTRAQVTL